MLSRFFRLASLAGLAAISLLAMPQISQAQTTSVSPSENNNVIVNPDCGWGLWAGPHYSDGSSRSVAQNTTGFGDNAPLFQFVVLDFMWSDLEPAEGQFDWSQLDQIMNYWTSRGKQIELRLWVTDDPGWGGPGVADVVPTWVWNDGAKYHSYTSNGQTKREPAYADATYSAIYTPKLKTFLAAVKQKYDVANTPIVMFDNMGYGNWGEWHVLESNYPWPSETIKRSVLSSIIAMYDSEFQYLPLTNAYCYDTDDYGSTTEQQFIQQQALDVAVNDNFIFSRHGFIDGLENLDTTFNTMYFSTHPFEGEGDWTYAEMINDGTHGTLAQNLSTMLDWHCNWAHFYMDASGYQLAERDDPSTLQSGLEQGGLGYRLVPTNVSWPSTVAPGSTLTLSQSWVNRSAGRCYRRYPLKMYLLDQNNNTDYSGVDSNFDETNWVSGTTYSVTSSFTLPNTLAAGTYNVAIALADSGGTPRIALPISGGSNLIYTLGTITVGANGTPTVAVPSFSPAAGSYSTAQSVTLSDSTSGATLYYTTNGSTPTTGSTKYTGAIAVSSTETIKAIAAASGYNNSAVGTAAYAISSGSGEAPYGGTAWAIPGMIQAENYDTGGQNVGYYQTVNGGQTGYRSDNNGAIEACSDTGGGYDVGYTAAGQWLDYTVNVASTGTYAVTFRVASPSGQGNAFHLQNSSGTNLSGEVTVPNTGGWQTWTNVTATVALAAGSQVIRLWEDAGNFNVNYMSFGSAGNTVYSFADISPSYSPVNGTHSGINFGTGNWYADTSFSAGGFSGPCGYFSSGTPASESFTLPSGKYLKSIVVGGDISGTFSISDRVNTTINGNVTAGNTQTLTTNWTKAGTTVTVYFQKGWDGAITAITY